MAVLSRQILAVQLGFRLMGTSRAVIPGNSTLIKLSTRSTTMGTWISIWRKPKFLGTRRRQRAKPGCENLRAPFQKKVLSMKIEWNVKDSFPLHFMCRAIYFWSRSNCSGSRMSWKLPGGINNVNTKKYNYPTSKYSTFTGKYAKIYSIQCALVVATPSPRPSVRSPPPKSPPPPSLRPLDLGCVAPHNNARVAVGLPGLKRDPALVASAQRWANTLRDDSCKFYHSTGKYGENLFMAWGAVPTCARATESWVKEKSYYSYNSNTCASGKACGHYTQIVWRNTKRLGCARSTCSVKDNIYIWVCHYDPGGNYVGQKPY